MSREQSVMVALARRMEPRLTAAFIESITNIRSTIVLRELSGAVESGDVQSVVRLLNLRPEMLGPFTRAYALAYSEAGAALAPLIDSAVGALSRRWRGLTGFDPSLPRAAMWAASSGFQLAVDVIGDQTEAVRLILTAAIARGDRPESVARQLAGRYISGQRRGGVLGLTAQQAGFLERAREELSSPSTALRFLRRELRDRRYDSTVRSSAESGRRLTGEQISGILSRYSDRMLHHRAVSIARTEFHVVSEAARAEYVQQLVDRGVVSEADIMMEWVSRGFDGKTRHTHLAMSGQQRRLGEPFRSPSGALLLRPGDRSLGAPAAEIVRCRCRHRVVRRASRAGV